MKSYLKSVETISDHRNKGYLNGEDFQGLMHLLDRSLFRGDAAEIDKVLDFVVRKLES